MTVIQRCRIVRGSIVLISVLSFLVFVGTPFGLGWYFFAGYMSGGLVAADEEGTRNSVLRRFPKGSPVADVGVAFERIGFLCKPSTYESKPILYCDSGERGRLNLVTKRWQIILIEEDGRLVDVRATVGLTGP